MYRCKPHYHHHNFFFTITLRYIVWSIKSQTRLFVYFLSIISFFQKPLNIIIGYVYMAIPTKIKAIKLSDSLMSIYLLKINFFPPSFLRYCKDIKNLIFGYCGHALLWRVKVILLACRKLWCLCLYVLLMSRTRFRVNPPSIVAWMSKNSLLKTGATPEV